jgi:hypothetical protein
MAKDLRFISRDDVFMGNSSILNLAVKNHAKYILFSKRGEPAPADNHVAFNRITSYFDTEVESDVPDEYTLAEIIPLNGGNR